MSSTRAHEMSAPVARFDPGPAARRGPESLVVRVDPGLPRLRPHPVHGHGAPEVEALRLVGGIAPLLAVEGRQPRRQVRHAVELARHPAAVVEDQPRVLAEVVEGAADPRAPFEERGAEKVASGETRHQRAIGEEPVRTRSGIGTGRHHGGHCSSGVGARRGGPSRARSRVAVDAPAVRRFNYGTRDATAGGPRARRTLNHGGLMTLHARIAAALLAGMVLAAGSLAGAQAAGEGAKFYAEYRTAFAKANAVEDI